MKTTPHIYLAPMEGVTNYVYRKAYAQHFAGVNRYFTPFITPHKKEDSLELNI